MSSPIRYRSAGTLVQAVRMARANPHARFAVPGQPPLSAEDILANFAKGLMRRCNRGLDLGDPGRFQHLLHDARVINEAKSRIRHSGRNLLHDARMARRFPLVHNPPSDF